jgi:hypothetical protein
MDSAGNSRNVQSLISSVAGALDALGSQGIPSQQVMRIVAARSCAGVPISIFNSRLGSLESIVKYMREELLLDYTAIACLLSRGEGPIGVTYRRAKRKLPGRLDVTSKDTVPFSVFENHRLSVLENISCYLAEQGFSWHEIAAVMHRHDKTIWTVLYRAKKKMKGK